MNSKAKIIGAVRHMSDTYFIWEEPGRADNVRPFYYGVTKNRRDEAPDCAYADAKAMLRSMGLYRCEIKEVT